MGAEAPLSARLSYAQCWEDPDLLRAALRVGPDDCVLSIASGGCNSIDLALAGAGRVLAVDLSEPQLAVTELKLAGGALAYDHFLELVGLRKGDANHRYRQIRDQLSDRARGFFDAHPEILGDGLLRAGRFERYLATFRTRVLPWVHSRATIEQMLTQDDSDAQRQFFDQRWNTWRWRGLFRMFFSRFVMARLGRSPEHFTHVEGTVADRLLARTEHVLTALPVHTNPYLQWILSGEFRGPAHRYLSEAGHAQLPEIQERVTLIHGTATDVLAQPDTPPMTAFNLSNLGEYLSTEEWKDLYVRILTKAAPGARLAYWNLFVPRHRPDDLAERVTRDTGMGEDLLARDRAFFYGAFQVERVQ